jgi:hypothetical protein
MATKKARRALRRTQSDFTELIDAAKGDGAAADALHDKLAEEGLDTAVEGQSSLLMMQLFRIGLPVYIETCNWVYLGVVNMIGRDFVVLEQASRSLSDGSHPDFMSTGRSDSMELAPTGGPLQMVVIPSDWIGPWLYWPFEFPTYTSPASARSGSR